MNEGAKRHVSDDLGAVHLVCDNKGDIAWAKSKAITKQMRHVNICKVAVRNSVQCGDHTFANPGNT